MKFLYILIAILLTSCSSTKLRVDQDNYNDYIVHTNPKLIIPQSFDLPKPVTQNSQESTTDKQEDFSQTELSVIDKTKNFSKEKSSQQNLNKRKNKLQRIF